MQKTISALAIAGSIALLGASAAQAQPIQYPAPIVNVSENVIVIGGTVIFFGEGFVNNGTINITIINTGSQPVGAGSAGRVAAVRTGVITLNQKVAEFTAPTDGEGKFSEKIKFNEAGTYTLQATGLAADGVTTRTVTTAVTVQAAAVAPVSKPGGTTTPGTTTTSGTTTSGTSTTRGGLANTGIDSAMFLWGAAGIGALGLGAGSIVVARRRTGAEA